MTSEKKLPDLGRKLLDDFNASFRVNQVNEVCVIYNHEKTSNTCPVQVQGNCVGVERWCVKQLFTFAYESFMEEKEAAPIDTDHLHMLTRCVVVFCPDCTTAWNTRKKLLQKIKETSAYRRRLLDELDLCRLALRMLPKSSEAFAHRRWVLRLMWNVGKPASYFQASISDCDHCGMPWLRLISSNSAFSSSDLDLLRKEFLFCSEIASCHPNNYSCWSHRVWLINRLILPCLLASDTVAGDRIQWCQNLLDLLLYELRSVMKWLESHVSDHSCMSHIQFLLVSTSRLSLAQIGLTCKCGESDPVVCVCDRINLLPLWRDALQQTTELLHLFGEHHEALWSHRRMIIFLLKKLSKDFSGDQRDTTGFVDFSNNFTFEKEKEFCDDFSNASKSNAIARKYANDYLRHMRNNAL